MISVIGFVLWFVLVSLNIVAGDDNTDETTKAAVMMSLIMGFIIGLVIRILFAGYLAWICKAFSDQCPGQTVMCPAYPG